MKVKGKIEATDLITSNVKNKSILGTDIDGKIIDVISAANKMGWVLSEDKIYQFDLN